MLMSPEAAHACVTRAISSFNDSEGTEVPIAEGTVLLGVGGAVDSLGLVRLILEVEREVEHMTSRGVSLTDERAMSQRNSPFRSVGALIEYIVTVVNEPS
ncbi:MAG: acyl carrier protein [Candidatus Eisenbacteria bacterium]